VLLERGGVAQPLWLAVLAVCWRCDGFKPIPVWHTGERRDCCSSLRTRVGCEPSE
jgi:hypothetical protein